MVQQCQRMLWIRTSQASLFPLRLNMRLSLNWTKVTYTYTLKIINPKRKSQFRVEKFRKEGVFKSPLELQTFIAESYKECVPPASTEFDIGYFKPSRGSSKVYIKSNADIECMYESYKDQLELNIWCIGEDQEEYEEPTGAINKRRRYDQDPQKTSRRQSIRDEVDEIFLELKEKHEQNYTAQQLRLWANMLQIGTWKDRDNPPKNPMFGYNGKSQAKPSLTDALASVAEGLARAIGPRVQSPSPITSSADQGSPNARLAEMGVSPSKCAKLRSQYIEQLKQLHQLLELTAISKDEYDEQKGDILKKMHEL